MPLYECNENQFVENIRRLLETGERFVVNRRVTVHDDAKYGPATLPDEEFRRYGAICDRKSLKSTVYARVPFVDAFHSGRLHDQEENLHSSSSLLFPRLSIPYFRVEYSVNIWGGTYLFSFDALFDPEIKIEKRSGRSLGKGALVHVLNYNPPKDRAFTINLPKQVVVLDVKQLVRTIDHSSLF